jgi:hypothetical protein
VFAVCVDIDRFSAFACFALLLCLALLCFALLKIVLALCVGRSVAFARWRCRTAVCHIRLLHTLWCSMQGVRLLAFCLITEVHSQSVSTSQPSTSGLMPLLLTLDTI